MPPVSSKDIENVMTAKLKNIFRKIPLLSIPHIKNISKTITNKPGITELLDHVNIGIVASPSK
jgi:hypothetical protein